MKHSLTLLAVVVTIRQPGHQRLRHRGHGRNFTHRGLGIGDPELQRPESRMRPQLPPPRPAVKPPARRSPGQRLGVFLPAVERGRHALARQQLAQLGANRRQAGVAAFIERTVGGQRRQQRKI